MSLGTLIALLSSLALLGNAVAEVSTSDLEEWNTLRVADIDDVSQSTSHTRQLLFSSGSCACVCAGTHEGYVPASVQAQCTTSACVNAFPSCSYGEASPMYSDGSLPSGEKSGTMVLQSSRPDNCHQAIIGATCAQQYQYGVDAGFIQLISTSSDACVPGSAQQSIAYKTRNTLAAGHFMGNINNSAFTLMSTNGLINLNINQGCVLSYKVTSGQALLGTSSGGKCFPAASEVQTPHGKKRMADLRLNDEVLTVLSSGAVAFQPVFMFSHLDSSAMTYFVALVTSSGQTISASPGHYLWVTRQKPSNSSSLNTFRPLASLQPLPDNELFQGAQIVTAEGVTVGDLVWVHAKTMDTRLTAARVVSVQRRLARGLYNPHTASGSIIVDGVAALSFTDTLPRSTWVHTAVTGPAWALHSVLPSSAGAWLNARLLRTFAP